MQIEKNRFLNIAETFDKVAQRVVPQYDFLQDEVIRFLDYPENKELCVFDLGAGSGIFLEKLLNAYPNLVGYWIDYSPDFLKVAKNRLHKFGDRVKYFQSNIEQDWDKLVEQEPDLILSMSTIHHLEDSEKKALYLKCYELLKNNGWFVNVDEMKTLNIQGYKNNLLFKEKYAIKAGESIDSKTMPYYNDYLEHLKLWHERNIENFELPKQKGDDLHASFITQVEWLDEIGFRKTDIIIKYHLMNVLVGQK